MLPDDLKKTAEALVEFGLDPEAGEIDAGAVDATVALLETLPLTLTITPMSLLDPCFRSTLDALSPVVFAASARRRHQETLDKARHAKKGQYGHVRATMISIREEIDRRGVVPGSSVWKEAIKIMRSRRDEFSFEYADDGGDASGEVACSKSADDCNGVICFLTDGEGKEYKASIGTIGQYLKTF